MPPAAGVLLFEEAAQEFVKWGVWKPRRWSQFRLLGHCLSVAFLRNGYVYDSRQDFFYQRREALLLNQCDRGRHCLWRHRCRLRWISCSRWILCPDERRESKSSPKAEPERRGPFPVQPRVPGNVSVYLCQLVLLWSRAQTDRPVERELIGRLLARRGDRSVSSALIRCNPAVRRTTGFAVTAALLGAATVAIRHVD